MKPYAFAAIALASTFSMAGAIRAQTNPASSQAPVPMIVTTGQGEVKVTPDRATVSVGIQTRATSAATAGADNARLLKAIIDTIHALGIPSEQISTQNYNVNPEMQYDPQGRAAPKVTAYTVTNTVRVELKKIDQVASVIDAGLARGANQVNGVEFSVSNADEARRTALGLAIARARADAEAMAKAAGGTLGALIQLSAPGYQSPITAMTGRPGPMSAMAAQPTPIEPGQQSITAFVNASWVFIR